MHRLTIGTELKKLMPELFENEEFSDSPGYSFHFGPVVETIQLTDVE